MILALIAVTLLKILWSANSAGTIDAILFFNFAKAMRASGLCQVYGESALFNHTPLTAGFVAVLHWISGGEVLRFSFLLRLASSLADAVLVVALLFVRRRTGKPPWWALLLFAASPVSIMVSGFHGNVDPIMTLFLFLAAVACLDGRALVCGLLFGLACNVKVAPMVFGPVFLFYWAARGKGWRFVAPTGALILIGSAWPLVECPSVYVHNVFGYGSTWGVWGLPYWLRETGGADYQTIGFQSLSHAQLFVSQALKIVIVAGACILGWQRRAVRPEGIFSTLAIVWGVFFVFAPGIAAQYLVWGAPFILMFSPRWYAAVTAASSLFMVVFYQSESTRGRFPWVLVVPKGVETPLWSAWGNIAWLTFILFLIWAIRNRHSESTRQLMTIDSAGNTSP